MFMFNQFNWVTPQTWHQPLSSEESTILERAISISFLAPEFVLNKFYPKFDEKDLSLPCGWWVSHEDVELISSLVIKYAR